MHLVYSQLLIELYVMCDSRLVGISYVYIICDKTDVMKFEGLTHLVHLIQLLTQISMFKALLSNHCSFNMMNTMWYSG